MVAVPVQRAVSRSCSENLVSAYIDCSEDKRTVWRRVVVRLWFPFLWDALTRLLSFCLEEARRFGVDQRPSSTNAK